MKESNLNLNNDDLISRRRVISEIEYLRPDFIFDDTDERVYNEYELLRKIIEKMVPESKWRLIHCIDCKFYTPMNRETKSGICNLTLHQNFGDDWFCAGAERRTDGVQN